MRTHSINRIGIILAIALACAGLSVLYFYKTSPFESEKKFDLYTLVPKSAITILETEDMPNLIADVNNLTSSREGFYLYQSKIFSFLKKNLANLLADAPHGLSSSMNKMLISFHNPYDCKSQVLYSLIENSDIRFLDHVVTHYCKSNDKPKSIIYRGEQIRTYLLPDGEKLSAYLTSEFIAISLEKNLIEQVIDARKLGKSVLNDGLPSAMNVQQKGRVNALIYTRLSNVEMGKFTDKLQPRAVVCSWAELILRASGNTIYFSGYCKRDYLHNSFVESLRNMPKQNSFPNNILPASTISFTCSSLGRCDSSSFSIPFYSCMKFPLLHEGMPQLQNFINVCQLNNFVSCQFYVPGDKRTVNTVVLAPFSLSVEKIKKAFNRYAVKTNMTLNGMPCFRFPNSWFMAHYTGMTERTNLLAVVFNNNVLFSTNVDNLVNYQKAAQHKNNISNNLLLSDGVAGLSDSYKYMLVADLEKAQHMPDEYVRFIPRLLFRNMNFFSHFVYSIQFSEKDGCILFNVVLTYKPTVQVPE